MKTERIGPQVDVVAARDLSQLRSLVGGNAVGDDERGAAAGDLLRSGAILRRQRNDSLIGELAIYEALVCIGLTEGSIVQHFHKLMGYGMCDMYFHVIYSYAPEPSRLLDFVKDMACSRAPAAHECVALAPIGPPDHPTQGFLARYVVDHREVAVAFLLVDLAQPGARAAVGVRCV